MALKSRNETENWFRSYVSFLVKLTRKRLENSCFHSWNETSKFTTLLKQENFDVSAHDSTGPCSVLSITRFLWEYFVKFDYNALLRNFLWLHIPARNFFPSESQEGESMTCGRSRRNGTRCLHVSFLETRNAQGKALVCFEKRNTGENRALFLLFHCWHASTRALVTIPSRRYEELTFSLSLSLSYIEKTAGPKAFLMSWFSLLEYS